MEYKWRSGSRVKADAQVIGEELERLRDKHVGLTSEVVLTEASKKRSVLHPLFDWNDKSAAEQYRLVYARYLIRSVEVIVEEFTPPRPVRAFVFVKNSKLGPRFEGIHRVMNDEDMRAQTLTRALADLRIWQKKYQDLREFAMIFELIEQFEPA